MLLPTDPSKPFGNAGRNSVRQTGMFTLNLGIYKDFPVLREGMKVQFRAELFNATNKTNFWAPVRIEPVLLLARFAEPMHRGKSSSR